MNLSAKAQEALDRVVEQFKSGDLSPIMHIARIKGQGIPSDKWSLSNRILAYIQTGSLDCRGYRQWQKAGRHVRKGERAAYILAPCLVPVEDEETGQKFQVLRGFRAVAVFGYEQTEGEDLPEMGYTPAELPPLADVAERMGIDIRYVPLPPDRLGACTVDGQRIRLGSHDPSVFFHELAHAAHARLEGGLSRGQVGGQETVAEFTAAVLMHLYGLGDRTGNCWQYIQQYAMDPLVAITRALGTVEQVLALMLEPSSCQDAVSESREEEVR
jgi:hypothetical protein